jgi:hypothetical protein
VSWGGNERRSLRDYGGMGRGRSGFSEPRTAVPVLTSGPEEIASLRGRDVTVIKVLPDGQAFAERGGEAEFGAQPAGVDRSFAARGGEGGLVFELAQQALQPECL